MLWRFSFASTSMLETLLSRETPPSLEELMDEQDILEECKAQNNKLAAFLSREDCVKSLLQWVVAGLDDLDQEAADADSALYTHVLGSADPFTSYNFQPLPVPGPGPASPPLEPAKMVDELDGLRLDASLTSPAAVGLGQGLGRTPVGGQEDVTQSRYPRIATEILTSELWTITETIMNHKESLLIPFWDAILPPIEPSTPSTESTFSRHEQNERERARDALWSEEDEDRDRKREMIRGMWVRVNGALLAKRATEMIKLIQTIPDIVNRMIAKINSPAVQDMIIRIVSSDEAGVNGVNTWLADEGLISSLIGLLSPANSTTTISIASEVLNSVITLCVPLPFNPSGGNGMEQQNGEGLNRARDNRLIRELVSEPSITTLIGYMLDELPLSDKDWKGVNDDLSKISPEDPFIIHPLPSIASATTSFTHICHILTEVIRRNNSDFAEPHLFHTFRNRLMTIRQHRAEARAPLTDDQDREEMEEAMLEMSQQMGIVFLGNLLDVICERFDELHRLLTEPRSQAKFSADLQIRVYSPVNLKPLTLERFRIIELYAELLHSSNMSMFNRRPGSGPVYSSDGVLSGGLCGLEALGEAIEGDRMGEDEDDMNSEGEITQARDLPVSSESTASFGSDDVSSEGERIIAEMEAEKIPSLPSRVPATLPAVDAVPPPPSHADEQRLRNVMELPQSFAPDPSSSAASQPAESAVSDMESVSHVPGGTATTNAQSLTSEQVAELEQAPEGPLVLPLGDRLKQKYSQLRVLPTIVDLFFEYPQNDFLHHVVYDTLQQVLNGRLGPGLNRELAVELIKEAKLIERILDAQRLNDQMVKSHKQPRLAYMGHIILIAEDVVKFLARCPPELYVLIQDSFINSEWEAFVDGPLFETKTRDMQLLAGGKPMVQMVPTEGMAKEDDSSDEEEEEHKIGEPLTRTQAQDGFAPRTMFDEEQDDSLWTSESGGRHVDSSDEEDDDADWLQPRHDDDEFAAFQGAPRQAANDSDDDDGWGNFASAPASADDEDPFGDSFSAFVPTAAPQRHTNGLPYPNPTPEPLTPKDWATRFDAEFEGVSSLSSGSDWSLTGTPRDQDDESEDGQTPKAKETELEKDLENLELDSPPMRGEDFPLPPSVHPELGSTNDMISPLLSTPLNNVSAGILNQRFPTIDKTNITAVATSGANGSGAVEEAREARGTEGTKPIDIPRPTPKSPTIRPHTSHSFSPHSPLSFHSARSLGSSHSSHFSHSPHSPSNHMSPPDPHLIQATDLTEPLGPGVSPDTKLTHGMLQKEVDGETITVPQDEIVRGVEDALERRFEMGREV
ncbi:hypothetical protein M231_07471 [Tremella mesenterica]|uniref:SIT4-associating protein/190 n=1 Tax=Tremella mesenterica TaxID=5217 RepID=A0A4Q1BFS4_TREME|nr:hypothetical protein M231_07471 [Tremella mesenterica]